MDSCRSLHLNVRSDEQGCVRDGTPQAAYSLGDSLTQTCYCNDIEPECNWIETEVDSRTGVRLVPDMSITYGKVTILRITVGPLGSMDLNNRYDCAYGMKAEERCSTGPASESANDYVVGAAVSCSDIPTDTQLSSTTLKPTPPALPGEGSVEGEDPIDEIILYIIIGGGALLLLALLIMVIILAVIITRNRRRKSTRERPKSWSEGKIANGSTRENLGYNTTDYPTVDENQQFDSSHQDRGIDGHQTASSGYQGGSENENRNDHFRYSEVIDGTNSRMSIITGINQQGGVTGSRIGRADQLRHNDIRESRGMIPEEGMIASTTRADVIDEADEFVNADVIEYGVPRAFTSSTYGPAPSSPPTRNSSRFYE